MDDGDSAPSPPGCADDLELAALVSLFRIGGYPQLVPDTLGKPPVPQRRSSPDRVSAGAVTAANLAPEEPGFVSDRLYVLPPPTQGLREPLARSAE